MNSITQFLVLLALDIAGLVALWFALRARIRRFLELENLLAGVREEARGLVADLNETADRNVSLVEDRISTLRSLLDELDRRMGVARRELETRDAEREVFERLRRRRPIVPEPAGPIPLELRSSTELRSSEARSSPEMSSRDEPFPGAEPRSAEPRLADDRPGAPRAAEPPPAEPRRLPEVSSSKTPIEPLRSVREEALSLYRKGFSASIIAARLGATVSEIELLVDLEERRLGLLGGGEARGGRG